MYLWDKCRIRKSDRWVLFPLPKWAVPMGRLFDFAKRRIAGYLVFWIVTLFIVVSVFKGNQPANAAGIFILAFALTMSFAFTGRMKRRQRARREALQRTGR